MSMGDEVRADKELIRRATSQICLNVYNGLLSSMQGSSKGSVLKKASQLTNVPYKTLYKIIRNDVKTKMKRSNFAPCIEKKIVANDSRKETRRKSLTMLHLKHNHRALESFLL
nr:unnamed protein product [Callosobruchus chinensis]